ncbi:SigE family RNA polymerase sigma factor [Spirillospora sp. NPDC050679]
MDLPLTAAVPPRAAPIDVGALYRGHAAGLIRLAMLMVGDAPTAEDVVQDAFLGLHRHHDALRDPGGALAYVRSAVLNRCRSVLRRRAVAGRFARHYEPPAWSAEDGAMAGDERRAVLAAVARLPRRQREVLALRFYCDLPEEEIARTLRISRGTVSSTTSRALRSLERILGADS